MEAPAFRLAEPIPVFAVPSLESRTAEEPGFEGMRNSLQEIARSLEAQTAIPAVAAQLPLIHIDDGQYRYGVVGAYGPMRARLNPTGGAKDGGDYFHGQTNGHGWTHGCLCYGADTRFINYMWNNMPHVPMPVSIDTPVQKP